MIAGGIGIPPQTSLFHATNASQQINKCGRPGPSHVTTALEQRVREPSGRFIPAIDPALLYYLKADSCPVAKLCSLFMGGGFMGALVVRGRGEGKLGTMHMFIILHKVVLIFF